MFSCHQLCSSHCVAAVPKIGVTLVNLQRQLAMIRCCAKNRSCITPRCGRFFAIFAVLQRVARFSKQLKSLQQMLHVCKFVRKACVANRRCKLTLQIDRVSHHLLTQSLFLNVVSQRLCEKISCAMFSFHSKRFLSEQFFLRHNDRQSSERSLVLLC